MDWSFPPRANGIVAKTLQWLRALPGAADRSPWLATVLVAGCAACVLLLGLEYPLLEPDEGRYAEIAREMLVNRDWIVPHLNNEPYLDKPPLFYWLTTTSFRLLGANEFAARLVPALAAWLTILIVHAWGRAVMGPRTGLLAAGVLVGSVGFVQCGRLLILDSLLTLWTTAALLAGYLACAGPRLRWKWWTAAALACGLGVLTKGPIAIVLVAPPLALWGFLLRRRLVPGLTPWLCFGAIVLLVAAPWHLAITWRIPSFLEVHYLRHHLDRFVAGSFHDKPFWFYAPVLLVGGLPWSLFAPRLAAETWRALARRDEPRHAALLLLVLAAGWCVLFFTASRGKLPSYVLPVAPPLALLLAWRLNSFPFAVPAGRRPFVLTSLAPGVLVAALAAGLWWAWREDHLRAPLAFVELSVIALACGLFAWRRIGGGWLACALAALGTVHLVTQVIVPAHALHRSPWARDRALLAMLREPQAAIACYGREWGSLPFYVNRNDVANFTRSEWIAMRAFLRGHASAYLITKRTQSPESMQWSVDPDARLAFVRNLGDLNVFHVEKQAAAPEPGLSLRPSADGGLE